MGGARKVDSNKQDQKQEARHGYGRMVGLVEDVGLGLFRMEGQIVCASVQAPWPSVYLGLSICTDVKPARWMPLMRRGCATMSSGR